MSQQYSLRWNNHQPNFISMFTTLLNTQTLVDVTLAAEGKQLLAHKVVLSACSTYFQSLFVDNPSPHPIVILKDVTFADLRTMVDFMYCGEVNVTEEQLPKVLDTAKLLKIKGLTEMPDSTSLTRSQGTSSEFHSQGDSMDSQRHSPAASPSNKRKRYHAHYPIYMGDSMRVYMQSCGRSLPDSRRTGPYDAQMRRKSSTGSTSLNMVGDENRSDISAQNLDAITLSSVPQQRRIREYHEIRTIDNSQQTSEQDNMQVEPLSMDSTQSGLAPGGQWTMMEHSYPRYSNACIGGTLQPDPGMYINNVINPHMDNGISNYATTAENLTYPLSPGTDSRLRRTKHFKRQSRVPEDAREVRKQTSDPLPSTALVPRAPPTLQKYESYPQFVPAKPLLTRKPRVEQEIGSLLIRAVTTTERQTSTTISTNSASFDNSTTDTSQTQRAKHTPAVRSGPPLSCNFCWNTVDECGRILRRKTQYHCPECRTNLCIVPCFHEYHEGTASEANTNAR